MLEDLIKLRNTLMQIETRGESTKLMSNCLYFVEDMIKKENEKTSDSKATEKE